MDLALSIAGPCERITGPVDHLAGARYTEYL